LIKKKFHENSSNFKNSGIKKRFNNNHSDCQDIQSSDINQIQEEIENKNDKLLKSIN
jgi:hypothetical protein